MASPLTPPSTEQAGTHPVLTDVMPLDAGSLHAEPSLSTAGAVSPGEVACLTDDLSPSFSRAPQLGAILHVGAGLGADAKGQLTLLVEGVAGPREVLWQRDGLGGLVQQAIPCGAVKEEKCSVRYNQNDHRTHLLVGEKQSHSW